MNLKSLFGSQASAPLAPLAGVTKTSVVTLVSESILSSSAVSEGTWIDAGKFLAPFSLTVYGFNPGDEVQVYASNATSPPPLQPPAPGDGTVLYGNVTITADSIIPFNHSARYIRCRKSAAGTPAQTTQAYLCGVAFN